MQLYNMPFYEKYIGGVLVSVVINIFYTIHTAFFAIYTFFMFELHNTNMVNTATIVQV